MLKVFPTSQKLQVQARGMQRCQERVYTQIHSLFLHRRTGTRRSSSCELSGRACCTALCLLLQLTLGFSSSAPLPAFTVAVTSLHPCATCCSNGETNPACDFSFDGYPGICCGSSNSKYACCPAQHNITCGLKHTTGASFQCVVLEANGTGVFPLVMFCGTALLVVVAAACLFSNIRESSLSEAVKRAEYQRICGHPEGYPSPFGSNNPLTIIRKGYQAEGEELEELDNHSPRREAARQAGVGGSNLVGNLRGKLGEIHDKVKGKVDSAIPEAVKDSISGTREAIGQASRSMFSALESAATAGIDERAPDELLRGMCDR